MGPAFSQLGAPPFLHAFGKLFGMAHLVDGNQLLVGAKACRNPFHPVRVMLHHILADGLKLHAAGRVQGVNHFLYIGIFLSAIFIFSGFEGLRNF